MDGVYVGTLAFILLSDWGARRWLADEVIEYFCV